MESRKKIFVTGANGFFGRILVDQLAARSWLVVAGTRDGSGSFPAGVSNCAYGSLPGLADLSSVLTDVGVIVHCAARAHVLGEDQADSLTVFREINTKGTLALARQAIAAGVRRFIFISSIGVNGNETSGKPFTADDAANPAAPYAISKLEAETGLLDLARESGLEVVILRPPLILGPEPVGNLATIARLTARGLPLPFGLATKNQRSLVSAKSLSSLIETCLDHPGAAGNIFVVADEKPMNTRQIIERVAEETGQKVRLLPVPVFLLRNLLRLAGKTNLDSQLFGDLEIDITETKAQLGWVPETRNSSDV